MLKAVYVNKCCVDVSYILSNGAGEDCNHEDHEEARRVTAKKQKAATTWRTGNLHILDFGIRTFTLWNSDCGFGIQRYSKEILDSGPR